jgi:hypothetical protein
MSPVRTDDAFGAKMRFASDWIGVGNEVRAVIGALSLRVSQTVAS